MSDQQLEQIVGNLLRAGVLLSAAVVLGGGIWLILECGGSHADYRQFGSAVASLRSPAAIVEGLAHPNPSAIIQFGLLLLVATPVARVILCLAVFGVQRDRMYAVITLIVLIVLAYSLAIPH
jgi:uncharacterized membrane protein